VMQTYERFVGIVSAARGIPVDTLRSGIADGRVVSGADAVAAKLVDRIGYIEDAYALARTAAGVSDAEVVRYGRSPSLLGALGMMGQASLRTPRVELDVSERLWPRLRPGRIYLLPETFVP
jgi:protease IV